jgi:hypothetical protein
MDSCGHDNEPPNSIKCGICFDQLDTNHPDERFEFYRVVIFEVEVFWAVTPCNVAVGWYNQLINKVVAPWRK